MNRSRQIAFSLTLILAVVLAAPAGARALERLPQWESPYEKALTELFGRPAPLGRLSAPPVGTVFPLPEYGPQDGILMVWDSGWSHIYRPMVKEIQEAGAIAYIVVERASTVSSVLSHLATYGIPSDRVEFIITNIDTVWIRDYGPFTILVDGIGAIADPDYSRPWRVNDDLFPDDLAGSWQMDHYGAGFTIDGGNFMSDECGTCMVSTEIFSSDWNPEWSPQTPTHEHQCRLALADYFGCDYDRTVFLKSQIGDGTGHIDMYAKFLDVETILLAQFPDWDPYGNDAIMDENYAILSGLETCYGDPYNIVRIDTKINFRTYTNSLMVNDTVLVPTYGYSYDSTALGIYQSALPGHEIVGINSSSMVGTGGSIHCIARELPAAPWPAVEPDSLDFGTAETTLTFDVTNAGPGRIDWDLEESVAWITSVTPASGSTTTESDTVTVTVNRAGLTAGEHFGSISFDSGNGDVEIEVKIVKETAGFEIAVDASYAAGQLNLNFTIGAAEPAEWTNYLILTSPSVQVIPLWSVSIPAIPTPIEVPVAFPLPSLGWIGIWTGLSTAGGLQGSDLEWVSTGMK